ncbi:MAG: adenylate/guanylate cyclase domain-containing protein, partial [Paracoccaceae bacterium]
VSVMSVDFEGFAEMLGVNEPTLVVSELNDIFTAFDRIGEQFGCERIRTMGDSYFAVAGVPDPVRDHAGAVAGTASRFLKYIERRNENHPLNWKIRVGIASGSVIGSVVGVQKYVYDVFGPAVSMATDARLQAKPMSIKADVSISGLLDDDTLNDIAGKA